MFSIKAMERVQLILKKIEFIKNSVKNILEKV